MRQIRADFVKTAKPSVFIWGSGAALAIAAAAGAFATLGQWHQVETRAQHLQTGIRAHDIPSATAQAAAPQAYDMNVRELMATRSSPWADALTMLESTAVIGVTVTQVDFGPTEHFARAEVTFTDYATMLDYLNALNMAAPAVHWSLGQTQGATAGGSGTTAVMFGVAGTR